VLDGTQAPSSPKKVAQRPIFGPVYCGQTVAHFSYFCALVVYREYFSSAETVPDLIVGLYLTRLKLEVYGYEFDYLRLRSRYVGVVYVISLQSHYNLVCY